MSDLMLYGVLRMPYHMAMADELARMQFYSRAQEAARRLEAAEARLAEIDAAPTAGGERQDQPDLNVLRPFAAPASQHGAWIAVEDQLPDLDVPVWLWQRGDSAWVGGRSDGGDGWLWCACHDMQYQRPDGTWDSSEMDADDDYQPTHWMPLPLTPDQSVPAGAARQGGDTSTPLAYIPPHIMESLRNGCRVGTVLEPKPENGCTEALYG